MFYATYVTGLHEPVKRLLEENNREIKLLLDGAVMYESRKDDYSAFDKAAGFLPAFFNVYETLAWEKHKGSSLDNFMKKTLTRSVEWRARLRLQCDANAEQAHAGGSARGGKQHSDGSIRGGTPHDRSGLLSGNDYHLPQTFRIVTSVENKLVSVNGGLKTKLEKIIAADTGLVPDRGGLGYEFLFLIRSEGYAFFLKRLTYHQAHEKVLRRGELRPELCFLLNYLSGPREYDRMLDPFCGCGAIPVARLKHFPCKQLYASDTDLNRIKKNGASSNIKVNEKPQGLTNTCTRIIYKQADIGTLHEWLPPASVDKIVTDPPWGLYNTGVDIAALYETMLAQFARALTDKGIIVLLTAQKDLARLLLWRNADGLFIHCAYDVLVSGKKAGVFVIKK